MRERSLRDAHSFACIRRKRGRPLAVIDMRDLRRGHRRRLAQIGQFALIDMRRIRLSCRCSYPASIAENPSARDGTACLPRHACARGAARFFLDVQTSFLAGMFDDRVPEVRLLLGRARPDLSETSIAIALKILLDQIRQPLFRDLVRQQDRRQLAGLLFAALLLDRHLVEVAGSDLGECPFIAR